MAILFGSNKCTRLFSGWGFARTLLGELTALPNPLAGKGEGKGGEGEGSGGEGREQEGEGRKRGEVASS